LRRVEVREAALEKTKEAKRRRESPELGLQQDPKRSLPFSPVFSS